MQKIYTVISSFNNNEIAILILLLLALICFKTLRKCFVDIIKVFVDFLSKNKIFQSIIFELFLYFLIITWVLYYVGFWYLAYLKDSLMWLFLSGFVLFKDIITKTDWKATAKNYLLKVISFSAVCEFLVNIICLPIWSLLLIFPIIFVFQIMSAYSENKEEYKTVQIFAEKTLTIIGFGILMYVGCKLVNTFGILLQKENLKVFILPIIYTIAFLPFSLIKKIFTEFNQAYMRLSRREDIKIPVNFIYIYKIYQFCKLDFEKLNKFVSFLTSTNYLNTTTKIDDLITEYTRRTTFLKFDDSCIGFEINKILNLFSSNNLKIDDYKDTEYDNGYGSYFGFAFLRGNNCSFDDIQYLATGTNQVIQKVEILYSKHELTPNDLSEEMSNLYLTLSNSLYSSCFPNEHLNKDLLLSKFQIEKNKYVVISDITSYNNFCEYKFIICVKEQIMK